MKKKVVTALTAAFALAFVGTLFGYLFTVSGTLLMLSVLSGTLLYHFAMRLIITKGMNDIFNNRMDYSEKWFQVGAKERGFYNRLKMEKWAEHIIKFELCSYDFGAHGVEENLMATCQAEIVHELIMVFSLLPIAFSILAGHVVLFIISSVVAFLVDGIFVAIQRFKRAKLFNKINNK